MNINQVGDKAELLAPAIAADALAQAKALLGMPIRVEQCNYEAMAEACIAALGDR